MSILRRSYIKQNERSFTQRLMYCKCAVYLSSELQFTLYIHKPFCYCSLTTYTQVGSQLQYRKFAWNVIPRPLTVLQTANELCTSVTQNSLQLFNGTISILRVLIGSIQVGLTYATSTTPLPPPQCIQFLGSRYSGATSIYMRRITN